MEVAHFGEWIKNRRQTLDLTQAMLAQRVGCSLSTIRKIESGERRPSHQIAELLALHLIVAPEERELFMKVARGERPSRMLSIKPASDTALTMPASTIPLPVTALVGRQQEIARLNSMLADPYNRLITILGPGGVGKTRLAVEVALAQRAIFEGRVFFTRMETLSDPESILPAVAATLGISSANSADSTAAHLVDALQGRNTLLVLDNFEHLLGGAVLLANLLRRAPQLKILLTSREKLDLQGEWTFEISGLPVPPTEDDNNASDSALQLFELQARRVRPSLQLSGPERAAAIQICRKVEGLPLAIELAAAWANILSCQEIADEVERGLDFLTSHMRDASPRHRSLRAVFERSWQRLPEVEQTALAQMAIFQGGFNREAAHIVTEAGLAELASLASRSLLHRSETGRYHLHAVIRQYAWEHLPGEESLRDRHSTYFLGLLHKAEAVLFGQDDPERIREFAEELGNIQIAWKHAIWQRCFAQLDLALPAYWMLADIQGWLQEGIAQLMEFIQCLRIEPHSGEHQICLGRAQAFCGMLLFRAGDYLAARHMLADSLTTLRKTGEERHLIPALAFSGITAALMGDFSRARTLIDEEVVLASKQGDRWFLALGQFNQGYIAGQVGDLRQALDYMQAGLAIWRSLGNRRFTAFALNFMSPILIQLGRPAEARACLQESLTLSTAIQDRWGIGTASGRLGMLSFNGGELQAAQKLLEQSVALFTGLGARWDMAWALTQLSRVLSATEEPEEARKVLQRATHIALQAQALPQVLDSALVWAHLEVLKENLNTAYKLVTAIQRHPACTQALRLEAEAFQEKLDALLPPEVLHTVRASSQTHTAEELIRQISA